MPAPAFHDVIVAPPGYRSTEAALFVAQLEDQSTRMVADLTGITAEELGWQPAPGMNTIGMLLAHIALVEVYWTNVGPGGEPGRPGSEIQTLLGIGIDDDGMPLDPEGAPPATLQGKDLAFYLDLLEKSRAHTRQVWSGLSDEDVASERSRVRRDGVTDTFDVRWVLYHCLEHLAGHYGQVLLLRHLYRVSRVAA
jgi:hypothetical protein